MYRADRVGTFLHFGRVEADNAQHVKDAIQGDVRCRHGLDV